MNPTKLKYFEDSYLFTDSGKVLKVNVDENGKQFLVLDQSIFYPQGGGQPYDTGEISHETAVFKVNEVRFKDGFTYHFGEFVNGNIGEGDYVDLKIDEERRRLNCKLHSIGHLIDNAIHDLRLIEGLIPSKGYHFPDGPYVEYVGELQGDLIEHARDVENKVNGYIKEGYDVKSEFVSTKAELEGRCFFIPEHLPEGKPIRLVFVYGDIGEACGGTHVKNISEIGPIIIPKIKVKGGVTRVSYNLV
jgi:alanyl-tRNA synthetase